MELSFRKKLAIVLIDKLLIAAIALLLGLVANRVLASYQARQNVLEQIQKQRVQRIADTWGLLNESYYRADELYDLFQSYKQVVKDGDSEQEESLAGELLQGLERIRSRREQRKDMIISNRFCLGRSMYERCKDFEKIIHRFVASWDDRDELSRVRDELKEARYDIVDFIEEFK